MDLISATEDSDIRADASKLKATAVRNNIVQNAIRSV